MTRYRGNYAIFSVGGESPWDPTKVQPHGNWEGIPYADWKVDVAGQPHTHRVILNDDDSCGKHTLRMLGEEAALPEGPISMNDMRNTIEDFDDKYEVFDLQSGTSMNTRDDFRPRKKLAFSRYKRDDKEFKHWSPLLPINDNEEAGTLLDLKNAYNEIQTLLRTSVTVPAKLDITPTVETTELKQDIATVSSVLTTIVGFFAWSATGLGLTTVYKTILGRFTTTPLEVTEDNKSGQFWAPTIRFIKGMHAGIEAEGQQLVHSVANFWLVHSYHPIEVKYDEKDKKHHFFEKGVVEVTRNQYTLHTDPGSGENRTEILDATRRMAEHVASWVTRLDFLKSINDYLKLYTQRPGSTSSLTLTNPILSLGLKKLSSANTISFTPYVLTGMARMIQCEQSFTSAIQKLFHDVIFAWRDRNEVTRHGDKFFP
jgi:hypothetical protein